MGYIFKVTLGRLVCRDTESTTAPHDIFALSGAVVVDGVPHGFAMPSVPINERQPWSYYETIFEGDSETPKIGLALMGWDVDDNEKWVRNREEAGQLADKISELSGYVPVVGDALAFLIDKIPAVVDAFVDWDENDELLKFTGDVDMSADVAVPFRMASRTVEVKFSGSDPAGYSDWDYSLFVNVSCTYSPSAPFGDHRVTKTRVPFISSSPSDWIGVWESEHVSCSIQVSEYSIGLLDVSVTETVAGVETRSDSPRVGISRVFLQLGIPDGGVRTELQRQGEDEGAGGGLVPRLVVERARGRTASVTDLFGSFSGEEQSLAVSGVGLQSVRDSLLGRVPVRRQSGADILELSNDAAVEIFHVLHDGERSGEVELHYMRPFSGLVWRRGVSVDEMLRKRLV